MLVNIWGNANARVRNYRNTKEIPFTFLYFAYNKDN